MNNKPKLVYIVGRGHSGSTLLELLLNRSRNIASMGEVDLLPLQIFRDESTKWVGRCSCNKRPYDCEVWGKIISDIHSQFGVNIVKAPFSWRLSDVGTSEEFKHPGLSESLRYGYHRLIRTAFYSISKKVPYPVDGVYKEWVSRRDYVAKKYAELYGVEAVVDASKDQLNMRDIDNYSELEYKFIYLTRDVRGNVWSAIKRESVTAESEAKNWTRLNNRILKMLSYVDKDKYCHVRYEDLCADSEAEISNIHKFVGINYAPVESNAEFSKRHTIAGNKIRFREIESVRQDLAWMNKLSKDDLNTIRRIAGPTAERLGYKL